MSPGNFEQIFGKMTQVYGGKAYPEERKKQFFKAFKFWDEDLFEKAVDVVIGESMTPPPLARFVELVWLVRKEQFQRDSESLKAKLDSAPPCHMCSRSGVLMASYWSEEMNRSYTVCFYCNCLSGTYIKARGSKDVQTWSHALSGHFQLQHQAPRRRPIWDERLPAVVEMLCNLIDEDNTKGPAFVRGLEYSKLSEDALFEVYNLRKSKRLGDPRLKEILSKAKPDKDAVAGVVKSVADHIVTVNDSKQDADLVKQAEDMVGPDRVNEILKGDNDV